MTDIEELKRQIRHFADGSFDAAARVESICSALDRLQRELEREKIERQTFQHGHRIASDNCVRLERELEEARKRRSTPNEMFAIVIDRSYDGEGLSLAVHDGVNYMFSDGDCYDREGDTLDGYTAAFLTQHQLEKKLEEARKDAERYRHARSDQSKGDCDIMIIKHRWAEGFVGCPDILTGERADAEIDAARQQTG